MGGMPGMPGMGGGDASAGGNASAGGGMPDISNMSMDNAADMMDKMNPDMMKAGMSMMKNMDPNMMKQMGKMMGRDVDEAQLEQMQSMMSNMSEDDMQKWMGRAQSVAGLAEKPMAAYKKMKTVGSSLGYGGALAILTGLLAVMMAGHVSGAF